MKKRYTLRLQFIFLCLVAGIAAAGQCPGGYQTSQLNWDHLDYFVTTGNYAGYVSAVQASRQRFAMGPNAVVVTASAAGFTLVGENTTHTGDLPGFTGADVQYIPTVDGDSVVIDFENAVANPVFALYDIDGAARFEVKAWDATGTAVPLNVMLPATTILTVTGPATDRIITAGGATPGTALNDGSAIISLTVPGNTVKKIRVRVINRGTDPQFWLSDINACTTGSFPNNWRNISRPFTGMPAYIITVVDNQFMLLDPATGIAKPFFTDPSGGSMNGLAYDPVNRIVYYVYNRSGPANINDGLNANNKTIRKYIVDEERLDVFVSNVTTSLGIPTFDNGVESAGASFYGGYYYFGVEGYNPAKNSGRENTIWRIELDAAQNPTRASQVYSARADSFWNGNNRLRHDWSDFAVSNNGMLYDFDGAAGDAMYYHFNLMTGQRTEFAPSGAGTSHPTQTGVDWAENIFNAGNTAGRNSPGFVVPYNGNGTVNSTQQRPISLNGVNPTGSWSDCGEAFRPLCDFGDAPSSYDPDPWSPAVHEKDTAIRIGRTWDREWLKMTPMDATGDGTDEDGLAFVPIYFPATNTYLTEVSLYNNTGQNATVIAWLDINGNGTFDAGEACQPVAPLASMPIMQTRQLYWPAINGSLPLGSATYLRIRLVKTAAGIDATKPTGYYDHGETEDYRVLVDDQPLTASLVAFTAAARHNTQVHAFWTVTGEEQLKGYTIQRSADKKIWTNAGYIPVKSGYAAMGNYQFTDVHPLRGRSYYRLQITAVEGGVQYSPVREVLLQHKLQSPMVIQTLGNGWVQIRTTAGARQKYGLQLADISGRILYAQDGRTQEGINTFTISSGHLAAGMYVVRLQVDEQTETGKLIIQ